MFAHASHRLNEPRGRAAPLLEVDGLEVAHGEVRVLRGVSLSVQAGEMVAVLGANGAGKTTLLRSLSGLHRSSAGRVVWAGRDLTSARPHQIARWGLMHVPEGRGVLGELTVADNLALGLKLRPSGSVAEALASIFELFPVLQARRSQRAAMLSGGEQQMLAIARSLAAAPRLLMIDEVSLGLAPKITTEIMQRLRTLCDAGLSVLLVEQNAQQALRFADRVFVLSQGAVAVSGRAADLVSDPALLRAYLGQGRDHS